MYKRQVPKGTAAKSRGYVFVSSGLSVAVPAIIESEPARATRGAGAAPRLSESELTTRDSIWVVLREEGEAAARVSRAVRNCDVSV